MGVIPSRWAATRFPGKPLAMINGKPMLEWVIRGTKESRLLQEVIVATDDSRIAELAEKCGARAVMTDPDLPTGTDRVWQAVRDLDADVVLNIQGDEPLVDGRNLDLLMEPFLADSSLEMGTLACDLVEADLDSKNSVKVILKHNGDAIYFSRFPIPYSRLEFSMAPQLALKHIGIYAYRRNFLNQFCSQEPTALEKMESLEQLRALYMGARIRVIPVQQESWGVDIPEDVQMVEKLMANKLESSKK